jgi:hypothetical protein
MGLNCSKISNKIEHCRTVVFPRWEYKINKFFSDKCYDHKSPIPSPRNSDIDIVVIEGGLNNYLEREIRVENDITLDDMEETPKKSPHNSTKKSLPQEPSTSVETSEHKSTSALFKPEEKDPYEEFVYVDIPDAYIGEPN